MLPRIQRSVVDMDMDVLFDGSGTYRRDPDGSWRYTSDGAPVPGASDLRLGEVYAPEEEPSGHRVVPRSWLGLRPGHPLAWVHEYTNVGARGPVLVPAEEWRRHETDVIGMQAPELHPSQLLGIDDVAAIAEVAAVTVRAYLHRRQMPVPIARIGGSPVWSRPVVERWASSRSGNRRR